MEIKSELALEESVIKGSKKKNIIYLFYNIF